MSVKTTGAEFKSYITSLDPAFWPEDSYYDDDVLIVDGVDVSEQYDFVVRDMPDSARVTIECGTVYKNANDREGVSLAAHFKRWRKAQHTAFLAIEVPKNMLESIREMVRAAGGKITRGNP